MSLKACKREALEQCIEITKYNIVYKLRALITVNKSYIRAIQYVKDWQVVQVVAFMLYQHIEILNAFGVQGKKN